MGGSISLISGAILLIFIVSLGSPYEISECGKKRSVPTVWGGIEAEPHEFPWMAFVTRINFMTGELESVCGGSLVHPKFILTAAHCVAGGNINDTLVIIGSNNVTRSLREMDFKLLSNIYIHPNYDTKRNQYEELEISQDIAILELEDEVDFGPNSKVICLPSEYDVEDQLENKTAIVAGWGTVGKDQNGAPVKSLDKLMEASVSIRSNVWCKKHFNFIQKYFFIQII